MVTLIIDLDNTVYSVRSIGDKLFASLFGVLEKPEYHIADEDLKVAKNEIMRRPFQKVAQEHGFPDKLVNESVQLLRELTYDGPMEFFEEYSYVRQLPVQRFLVTTGFTRLQQSKVTALGIAGDFKEIFIVDPDKNDETKKDVIEKIITQYRLKTDDILVIGDDPESEIRAANDLQLKSFLLDSENKYYEGIATYKGRTLKDLEHIPMIKNL